MIHQLAYLSTAKYPLPEAFLQQILVTSRTRNAADGITGLLIYHDRLFFQVLEGEKAAVLACYARIERDGRHGEPTRMLEREVEHRAYPDWSMGYASSSDLTDRASLAIRDLGALHRQHESGGEDAAVGALVRHILAEMQR